MYSNPSETSSGTMADNKPVGTAGQPMNTKSAARSEAINRRMKQRQDSIRGKKN